MTEVYYDVNGNAHTYELAKLDGVSFALNVWISDGEREQWHHGVDRQQHETIRALLERGPIKRARIMPWHDLVRPEVDGHQPGRFLQIELIGERSWAAFHTGERANRAPLVLLTANRSVAPDPVRWGRDIYFRQPYLPEETVRAAAIEYATTGEQPTSVAWLPPSERVPVRPFGLPMVSEDDLPPQLTMG